MTPSNSCFYVRGDLYPFDVLHQQADTGLCLEMVMQSHDVLAVYRVHYLELVMDESFMAFFEDLFDGVFLEGFLVDSAEDSAVGALADGDCEKLVEGCGGLGVGAGELGRGGHWGNIL